MSLDEAFLNTLRQQHANILEIIYKDHYKSTSDNKTNAHKLIDGLLVCNKCKKGNFIKTTRQTRSADEGMTLIELCNFCGHKK